MFGKKKNLGEKLCQLFSLYLDQEIEKIWQIEARVHLSLGEWATMLETSSWLNVVAGSMECYSLVKDDTSRFFHSQHWKWLLFQTFQTHGGTLKCLRLQQVFSSQTSSIQLLKERRCDLFLEAGSPRWISEANEGFICNLISDLDACQGLKDTPPWHPWTTTSWKMTRHPCRFP